MDRPIALEPTALGIRSGISQVQKKGKIMSTRPLLPPFTRETAVQKVRLAEDGLNSRDLEKVALAYTPTLNRGTARSSCMEGKRSSLFLRANGPIAVRFAYEGKLVISCRRGAIHWKSLGGIANGFI